MRIAGRQPWSGYSRSVVLLSTCIYNSEWQKINTCRVSILKDDKTTKWMKHKIFQYPIDGSAINCLVNTESHHILTASKKA